MYLDVSNLDWHVNLDPRNLGRGTLVYDDATPSDIPEPHKRFYLVPIDAVTSVRVVVQGNDVLIVVPTAVDLHKHIEGVEAAARLPDIGVSGKWDDHSDSHALAMFYKAARTIAQSLLGVRNLFVPDGKVVARNITFQLLPFITSK